MKQRLRVKYPLIATLLVAVALCLLALPFADVRADPPEPTPSPAMDIRTRLQPYQTPGVEPAQPNGQLFEEAPPPSEMEEPPLDALAQRTIYCTADATVLQGYPSLNAGTTTDMWAGYDGSDTNAKIVRSLIKCSIASLPSNATITKATLKVYLVTSWDFPNSSRTITAYRITSNWSESSVTWNNSPGYGNAYGSRSIVHGDWGWYEFDVTNLVKAWYDGTYTNYGIMLRGPEVSGYNASWRGFGTRESSYRPQLVVEYSPAAAPQVNSITPNTGGNTGVVHITNLAGANFQAGAIVKLTKAGQAAINATNVDVVSPSKITCNFNLSGAATGPWNVVVTNPNGQSGTLPNGFTVTQPPPQVNSITPNTGANDGVIHITNLVGANFQAGATVKLTKVGQSNINATNVDVVSPSKITCDFNLSGAATGPWNVVVTNPDGQSGTLPGGFNVISSELEEYFVYLPIILNNAGPPSSPVLNLIGNSDGDGSYTVSWSNVSRATGYVLQEDDNASFTSPTTAYSGASTSKTITGKAIGTYYYRVQATNSFGSSPWSNVVSVQVTQAGVVPEPGTWYCYPGSLTIRFTVSSDSGSVSNGRIIASCGSKSIAGPTSIENGSFKLSHSDGVTFIRATFDKADRAQGSFGFWVSGSCWAIGTMSCSH